MLAPLFNLGWEIEREWVRMGGAQLKKMTHFAAGDGDTEEVRISRFRFCVDGPGIVTEHI